MRFISLFSGIEAASVAWGPLGWEAAAFAEIEPFPCAVLKYRFPDVPNLGDVTKIDWRSFIEESGPVDLVCGGSPCQSFSIAGGREGLDGESRLMYEYIRAVDEVRPRWLLWENVPGVFSIDGGRAFGILIDALEELGYGLAWRTLDAQFFGVAQRRRRCFVVGHIGDVGRAAAVLFDAESVRGNTLTGREKRAALAEDARGRVACGFVPGMGAKAGGIGFELEQSPTLVTDGTPAVSIQGSMIGGDDANGPQGAGYDEELCYTLNTVDRHSVAFCESHGKFRLEDGGQVRTLASQPGGYGEGLNFVCLQTRGDVASTLRASAGAGDVDTGENVICMASQQSESSVEDDMRPTITAAAGTSGNNQPVICIADNTANAAIDDDMVGTLKCAGGVPAVTVRSSGLYAPATTRESARTMS